MSSSMIIFFFHCFEEETHYQWIVMSPHHRYAALVDSAGDQGDDLRERKVSVECSTVTRLKNDSDGVTSCRTKEKAHLSSLSQSMIRCQKAISHDDSSWSVGTQKNLTNIGAWLFAPRQTKTYASLVSFTHLHTFVVLFLFPDDGGDDDDDYKATNKHITRYVFVLPFAINCFSWHYVAFSPRSVSLFSSSPTGVLRESREKNIHTPAGHSYRLEQTPICENERVKRSR